MTSTQTNELLSLWERANDNGKQLMLDFMEQATTFGDEWWREMETHLKNNDKIGMKKAIQRYKERI